MTHVTTPVATWRPLGTTSIIGGCLLALGVAGELVVSVQERDGTVRDPALFAAFVSMFTVGAALLARVVTGLRDQHRRAGADLPRIGRFGVRAGAAGFALLGACGAVVLVTGLAAGAPAEWAFVFFGLGLLCLVVGATALGFGLRRSPWVGGLAPLLWVGAAGSLVAVTVFTDPWHDLGLLSSYVVWVVLGIRLRRIHPGGTLL